MIESFYNREFIITKCDMCSDDKGKAQTCLAAILSALGTGFCSSREDWSMSIELPESLGVEERLSLLLVKLRCFAEGVKLLREVRCSFLSNVSSALAFGASSST